MTNYYLSKILCVFIFMFCFSFKTYAASDLQAQAVSVANSSVGAVTTISFTVANVGTTPMSNFFINYKLNGINSNLQNYPFTIQVGQSAIITNMTFIRPPGNFSLCAYVYSAIDINHANDTVCGNFTAPIDTVNIPYAENFDGVITTNWGVTTIGPLTTKWELGTPNFGLTSSSYSMPYCYDVNLNTGYASDAETYLTTPFFNLTGKPNSKLDFWINYNTESGYDGAYMQYSLDNVNWNVLGTYLDVNGTNWYNVPSLFGSNISSTGWSGTNGGWQHITYKLNAYNFNGPVKFRFVFESDNVITDDGFSVDNFNVYQTPSTDIEVTEIVSPYNYNFVLNNIPVVIKVLNNGTVAASNFPIKYTIDNLPPVTYTYTGTVAPLNYATISLPSFSSALGTHKIKAYTAWPIDSVKSNDTLTKKFYCAKFQTLPVIDNLEGTNEGWYNESVNDTATKWELGQPNYGQTSTTHSGTKAWDINLNSAYNNNAETYLYFPFWDVPAVPNVNLSFWMNMCTNDQLTLEYSPDTSNWYTIDSYIYTQCVYQQFSYNLSNWGISGKIQFRMHFKSDNLLPNGDGVSVDDIILTSPPSYDFSLTKIAFPQAVHQMYGQIPVGIQIKNMGASSTNSMQIKYELDGQLLNTYNYNSILTYNEYQYLSLPSFTTTAGLHVLKVYIDWPSDSNNSNDTLTLNFDAVSATLQSLPYQTDFETTVGTWYNANFSFANNNWQLGTPAYGQTSGAHSGTNSWDINLNTPYTPDGLACLYSPVFDFTNAITPKLKFWLNYNMDFTDGAFLQYSTNGTTWNMLGILNDPNGINWYNQQLYYFNNIPGWAGQTAGWNYFQYDLDGLNLSGPVQFRYGFYSSQYGNGDGISLDDFEIELALQNDAQVKSINEPGAIVTSGIALNPVVTIRNNGSVPLTSLLLNYDVNNVYTNSYTWTGNLPYDSVAIVTLPAYTPTPGLSSIKVYSTWNADLNAYNDTLKRNYTSIVSANAPYVDNFDNAQFSWIATSSPIYFNEWQYGTPNYGSTIGCFTGSNCWDVNLNIAYNNLANAKLFSPYFNYSTIVNSQLGIYLNFDTEYGADGLRIEYTTNGTTWNVLGAVNQQFAGNWYNSYLSDGKPGWSYQSQGWKHAYISTPYLDGKNLVQFAFVFKSDFSITGIGATIDDFEISPTAGILENTKLNANIFPNPFTNKLNINLPAYIQHGNIVVKDLFGKTVAVKNISSSNVEFDTTEWNAQIYFIHITSDANTNVFKVERVK